MNNRHLPLIFASVVDKDAARKRWNEQFNNRAPSAERKPGKVEVKAAAEGVTEILLYDEIGYWGVTAKEFVSALVSVTGPVKVRINSPGGDVFDGMAIYNALRGYDGEVTTQIDGLAASAASVIAMAGSKCVMADSALMMCHCAWTLAYGNKAGMLEVASVLEKIDEQLAAIYAKKTKKSPDECEAMMVGEGKNDGTWFTAQEAKDFGLVDEMMPMPEEPDDPKKKRKEEMPEDAARRVISAMRRRLAVCERED